MKTIRIFNIKGLFINVSTVIKATWRGCLVICFLVNVSPSFAQKIDNYFRYKAVKMLGEFAHPSNTYRSGTYSIYPGHFGTGGDLIVVDVYYQDNYHTQIALRKQYGLFVELVVLKDNDFVSPFTAMQLLKDVMVQYTQSIDSGTRTTVEYRLERLLQRQISLANGADLALYTLNLEWITY